MRPDNAVGRAGVFESFRLGMSEKLYVRSLWPARRDAERPDGESWESRARGCCLVEREHTPASGRLRRQWGACADNGMAASSRMPPSSIAERAN